MDVRSNASRSAIRTYRERVGGVKDVLAPLVAGGDP